MIYFDLSWMHYQLQNPEREREFQEWASQVDAVLLELFKRNDFNERNLGSIVREYGRSSSLDQRNNYLRTIQRSKQNIEIIVQAELADDAKNKLVADQLDLLSNYLDALNSHERMQAGKDIEKWSRRGLSIRDEDHGYMPPGSSTIGSRNLQLYVETAVFARGPLRIKRS